MLTNVCNVVCACEAWRGVAWRGEAWRGEARRDVAWRGEARRGEAWRVLVGRHTYEPFVNGMVPAEPIFMDCK